MSQEIFSPEKTALDAICRRLREGRKMCVEVAHYFKLRSKAEYEYTRTLLNCLKNMVLKDDGSPFDEWWREVKIQTQETANTHSEAADNFNCLADELILFTEEQVRLAQTTEENIKRGNAIETAEFRKALTYRNYYQEKRKMHAAATETHNILKRFVTTPKKDLLKSQIKEERLKREKEVAGIAYEKAVERFVAYCKMWEPRMETAFKDLEDLEVKRLQTLRNKLWKGTNIDSLTAVKHDECCENIRQNLEEHDIFVDFKMFARNTRSLSQTSDSAISDISSGSPAAHSTPKPRRFWNTRQPRRNNFTVDEFGYATAHPPPESDSSSNAEEEIQKCNTASNGQISNIAPYTSKRISSDFGYATVKDVARDRESDLKEDHENFGVSNAINNVDQVQFEVENGKVEASKANDTRNDNDRIHDLSSPEDFATCTDEDVQIWKDNFGYASVKDIRRRKHSVQKEFGNNSQGTKPFKDIPDKATLEEPQSTVTENIDAVSAPSDKPLPPCIDERTTWL